MSIDGFKVKYELIVMQVLLIRPYLQICGGGCGYFFKNDIYFTDDTNYI